MTETVTRLYDPNSSYTSSAGSRTIFTIPAGTLVNSKKIKVINFSFVNANDGSPIYLGPRGVYQYLNNVSFTSLKGTQIDRMGFGALNIMGYNNYARFDNGGQYAIGRTLNENLATSIFVNSPSQISLTEDSGSGAAQNMEITLDISSMLQYLQKRVCISEGFQLILEWAPSVGNTYLFKNNKPPCLMTNEFLDPKVMSLDTADVIEFNTLVQDRYCIPIGNSSITSRLNAYFNMYISRMWYFNTLGDDTNGVAYQPEGEIMNLYINSKQVFTLQGIDTPAKKISYMTDSGNELAIPNGVTSNLIFPLGLYNPNYVEKYTLNGDYNAMFSYGCFMLDQWIQSDITLAYSCASKLFNQYVYTVAEVARTYQKSTDTAGYLSVQQAMSRPKK